MPAVPNASCLPQEWLLLPGARYVFPMHVPPSITTQQSLEWEGWDGEGIEVFNKYRIWLYLLAVHLFNLQDAPLGWDAPMC